MSNNIIGTNIKNIRLSKNITQAELGKLLNISHCTVASMESGRTKTSPEMIKRICNIFGSRKEAILGINYQGSKKDRQKELLNELFDGLGESSREFLLIRAKELSNIESQNVILDNAS